MTGTTSSRPLVATSFSLAAVALASCISLSAKARDMFAFGLSCPPDGVSVVPRGKYEPPPGPEPSPPPDVAADPDRLAYWRSHAGAGGRVVFCGDMFEVTGCGHRATYCCRVAQTDQTFDGRVYKEDVADCTLVAKDGADLVSPLTGIAASLRPLTAASVASAGSMLTPPVTVAPVTAPTANTPTATPPAP